MIHFDRIEHPSLQMEEEVVMNTDPSVPSWKDPIQDFLKNGTLPEDKLEAKRIQYRSRRYLL